MPDICKGVGENWVVIRNKYYCPSCQRRAEFIDAAKPYPAKVSMHKQSGR